MASERYSFSLTTFSPSGKLVQIEYALQAVSSGAPSVGIKAVNGVVLATEKKNKSILFEDHSTFKVNSLSFLPPTVSFYKNSVIEDCN